MLNVSFHYASKSRTRCPRSQDSGVESRQGALAEGRIHKRTSDRLLHSRCASAVAAPKRSAAYDEALSRWRRGRILLREELPVTSAKVGKNRQGLERRQ